MENKPNLSRDAKSSGIVGRRLENWGKLEPASSDAVTAAISSPFKEVGTSTPLVLLMVVATTEMAIRR